MAVTILQGDALDVLRTLDARGGGMDWYTRKTILRGAWIIAGGVVVAAIIVVAVLVLV